MQAEHGRAWKTDRPCRTGRAHMPPHKGSGSLNSGRTQPKLQSVPQYAARWCYNCPTTVEGHRPSVALKSHRSRNSHVTNFIGMPTPGASVPLVDPLADAAQLRDMQIFRENPFVHQTYVQLLDESIEYFMSMPDFVTLTLQQKKDEVDKLKHACQRFDHFMDWLYQNPSKSAQDFLRVLETHEKRSGILSMTGSYSAMKEQLEDYELIVMTEEATLAAGPRLHRTYMTNLKAFHRDRLSSRLFDALQQSGHVASSDVKTPAPAEETPMDVPIEDMVPQTLDDRARQYSISQDGSIAEESMSCEDAPSTWPCMWTVSYTNDKRLASAVQVDNALMVHVRSLEPPNTVAFEPRTQRQPSAVYPSKPTGMYFGLGTAWLNRAAAYGKHQADDRVEVVTARVKSDAFTWKISRTDTATVNKILVIDGAAQWEAFEECFAVDMPGTNHSGVNTKVIPWGAVALRYAGIDIRVHRSRCLPAWLSLFDVVGTCIWDLSAVSAQLQVRTGSFAAASKWVSDQQANLTVHTPFFEKK